MTSVLTAHSENYYGNINCITSPGDTAATVLARNVGFSFSRP
jgi:hypothetical protein